MTGLSKRRNHSTQIGSLFCRNRLKAKNADLSRGFTQLAVELIAISEVEDGDIFYGAVTTGDVWRFGRLDRSSHQISQDITLYRIPDDLENLLLILLGILEDM